MLHSRHEASANWNTLKLAAAAAAMAVLAGCAVAVPLRPLASASQDSRDRNFACTTNSKCPHAITGPKRNSHGTQLFRGGNIDDDPPDFILNGQADILR
jgi:hypothetical protein